MNEDDEVLMASVQGCSICVYRFGDEGPFDPVVVASEMDRLSDLSYFWLFGYPVLYRTGERVVSDREMEFVMFAAILEDDWVTPANQRFLQRHLEEITLLMSRSVSEQHSCDVAAALMEPIPADLERIEDALYCPEPYS